MAQTVARAMEVLRLLSEKPRSLGEIADHMEVHKSTALRLLQTLEEAGFVRRPTERSFDIGFGLVAMGFKAIDRMDAPAIAHASLQRLADRCGHTVHLAQLSASTVVYVGKVEGNGPVATGSRIGIPAPLHTAAVSKIILAYQPEAVRSRLLATASFTQYTRSTLLTPQALTEQLKVARARGWAEDDGEYEDFINCIAFPIFDATGRVNYGMSVTALKAIANLDSLREQVPSFRETAREISRALGWTEA